MTFSIAARSDDGTHWGVAVASKFLAVGAAVPGVRLGAGAVATQADPVTELIRLSGIHQLLFGKPEKTVPLEGEYASRLRAALDSLGWTNPADSDPDLEAALIACAGVENLEERMVPGELDLVVLEYLENRAAESGIA